MTILRLLEKEIKIFELVNIVLSLLLQSVFERVNVSFLFPPSFSSFFCNNLYKLQNMFLRIYLCPLMYTYKVISF